jgi:hypothetical protein
MCGRFTQHYPWQEVHAFLNVFGDLGDSLPWQARRTKFACLDAAITNNLEFEAA